MKKIVFLMMAWMGALMMQADDNYPYLTFETTDGAKVSVNTESLKLTINGTTLTVGDQQFTLTNLSKMYFSTADESTTTGIDELGSATLDDALKSMTSAERRWQRVIGLMVNCLVACIL